VRRIFAALNVVIAGAAGVIVLLGYFFPVLEGFQVILLQWAVILAGWAVLLGIGNLISVHLQKMRERRPGSIYSLVLLFFMLLTMIVSLVSGMEPFQRVMLDGILIPVEISLMAVLAVTIIYASIRMLRTRTNLTSIVFLTTAFIVLLGIGPWPLLGQIPFISDIVRPFVANVLATGGARGILIGVALGTITTGIRNLFGTDRPYGGS
jgi:hypothetical protein